MGCEDVGFAYDESYLFITFQSLLPFESSVKEQKTRNIGTTYHTIPCEIMSPGCGYIVGDCYASHLYWCSRFNRGEEMDKSSLLYD